MHTFFLLVVCNNGPAQGLTWASPGFGPGQPRPAQVKFLVQILVKQNNSSNSIHCNNKGGRARQRAPPFVVSVPAVAAVVLFDQNLDQKIDLGWPGLAWAKTGLDRSSPGLAKTKKQKKPLMCC